VTSDSGPPPDRDSAPPSDPYASAHEVVDRLRAGVKDEKERRAANRSFWRELPILILVALTIAVIIKTFFLQAFYIPSGSMEETLQINDRVMVNKLAYRFGDPVRGDVVVFDSPFNHENEGESLVGKIFRNIGEAVGISQPASEYIKRVIALPGETIEVHDGAVHIDGEILNEPWLEDGLRIRGDFGPETVPEGFVFLMGDNRNGSQDSRFFGPRPIEDIVGKAFVIVWPPSRWGGL
jgi:signal peptidase I